MLNAGSIDLDFPAVGQSPYYVEILLAVAIAYMQSCVSFRLLPGRARGTRRLVSSLAADRDPGLKTVCEVSYAAGPSDCRPGMGPRPGPPSGASWFRGLFGIFGGTRLLSSTRRTRGFRLTQRPSSGPRSGCPS